MTQRAFDDVLDDARAGSETAFAILYRSLAPAMLAFARGRGAPDPEGVVADTMTSVARNLGRFGGDQAAFRSWAFTIAYRRVLDDRRRAARRPVVRPLSDTDDWASGFRSSEAIVDDLASTPVMEALRRLGSEQRDVVLLRVVGELSVREVATVLGKREGAVKMIQARALEQLRRDLTAPGPAREEAAVGERDG